GVAEGNLRVLDPDGVRERRDRPLRVVRDVTEQIAPELADLLERKIRWVGVEHSGVALQDLRERPVRHALAVRETPSPQDDCPVGASLRAGEELRDEAAL